MVIQRKSKQRDAILANLRTRYDHPTAMDIYISVKKDFPSLSLGTLYRNLSQLEEAGEIIRIHDESNDHFDGNPVSHPHFKCNQCGKIYDLENVKKIDYNIIDKNISQIYGCYQIFYGICKECETIV